ncbi:MAG TPA: FkbM family methyltransferase [Fluviicola sp.]|nr:FkbM family methyltransferase [Fluviicola sp.]
MNRFVHSTICRELLNGSKIVLLDGGARGSLFPPFDKVDPKLLTVVKVEPDASAPVTKSEQEVVFNKAIWKNEDTISIHIANEPSVSSVYPPNIDLARRFIDIIGEPARTTKKVAEVQASSIDALFSQEGLPFPDFIKLDIHGCEHEALSGALQSLQSKTVALVIESWVIEAHKGQQLLFKTDELLHGHGFYPHETAIGAWDYKSAEQLRSKPQVVISESLYFKDVLHTGHEINLVQGIKLIAIAELYGHVGFALLLAGFMLEKQLISEEIHGQIVHEIRTNNRQSAWARFFKRVRNKLIRMLSDKN